jgi:hypothetical protein
MEFRDNYLRAYNRLSPIQSHFLETDNKKHKNIRNRFFAYKISRNNQISSSEDVEEITSLKIFVQTMFISF